MSRYTYAPGQVVYDASRWPAIRLNLTNVPAAWWSFPGPVFIVTMPIGGMCAMSSRQTSSCVSAVSIALDGRAVA